MAKLLSTAMTTPVQVTADTAVPLGDVVRKAGCDIAARGTYIAERVQGYYLVFVNAIFAPTASGTVTMQLMENGTAIPGAATTDVVGAANESSEFTLAGIVSRVPCCVEKNISVSFSAAGSLESISVTVVRV